MKNKRNSTIVFGVIAAIAVGLCLLSYFGIGSSHILGARNIKQGLDLKGGVSIVWEAGKENPTSEEMSAAYSLIRGRLDRNGYTEADLATSDVNRFQADIPGVEDAEQAVSDLGRTAMITFTDPDGNIIFDGSRIKTAKKDVISDSTGVKNVVTLEFDEVGTQLFAEATGKFVGDVIYIKLDDETLSAPTVETAITGGSCYISGSFTPESAEELAALIRAGSLPFELNVISMNHVGAKLGADALDKSLIAGFIGALAVLIFMAAVYRAAGLAADISLLIYIGLMLVILSAFGTTLTLPGIAGIVLSIGMAVDANVIIFERLKEELASGKRTFRSSLDMAFSRAFSAILDGNITTLISAVILYMLGTGAVKGFAMTLGIGVVLSMFTAIFVTRMLLRCFSGMGITNPALYGVKEGEYKRPDLKVIGMRRRGFTIAGAIIALGFAAMLINAPLGNGAFNYDVDFTGGTSMQIDIGRSDFNNNDIAEIITQITGQNPQLQRLTGTTQVVARMKSVDSETRTELIAALQEKYPDISEDSIDTRDISATVSGEMQRTAITATLAALAAMFIYVSVRFRDVKMGGAIIINQLVNVLAVFGVYALIRIPLNNAFIIAILTVLGYAINSTIVVFDRIRENKKAMQKKQSLAELVDTSVSQTLIRSLYASVTTLITIVFLYIFGVESVKQFTLPIIVGVIFGTFTSVCCASPLWHVFVEKHGKS